MTCIVFGSTTGNTESAAALIAGKLEDETQIIPVNKMTADSFKGCNMVLLGSSTWGMGELQDEWESQIDKLKSIDLSGKKVGFFGCGDQIMFSSSFVDAMGILYKTVKGKDAEIVGQWSASGYSFSESSALVDGKFIGLALDEENQSELTDSRINEWTDLLQGGKSV